MLRSCAHDAPILISGGGIAGLSVALALARNGIPCHILEMRDLPCFEQGWIQLSPNATRLLHDFGLGTELGKSGLQPSSLLIRAGRSGRYLAKIPFDHMEADYEAPYLVMPRADLQRILLARLGRYGDLVHIEDGKKTTGYEHTAEGVCVSLENGQSRHGRILIGADGLYSRVRRQLLDDGSPLFSGYIAWRGSCNSDQTHSSTRTMRGNDGDLRLWISSGAHLVVYPSYPGGQMNIVATASVPHALMRKGQKFLFNVHGHQNFENWDRLPRKILDSVPEWRSWPLFTRSHASSWHGGKVVLIGDAAHPMLPFLAQGGAMAIEDGATLATLLAVHDRQYETAFQEFSRTRRKRVLKIQRASRIQGVLYHLPYPLSILRDCAMGTLHGCDSNQCRTPYHWIYSWKIPPASFSLSAS